jgi:hypothetical protein
MNLKKQLEKLVPEPGLSKQDEALRDQQTWIELNANQTMKLRI